MQMAPVQQMGFQFGLLLEEKVHISARVTKAIWGGFFFFFLNAALDTLFLFFFSLVIIGFTTGNIQSGNKYRAPKRVKCCWHCDVANGALGTQCCCWLGLVWEQLKP